MGLIASNYHELVMKHVLIFTVEKELVSFLSDASWCFSHVCEYEC